MFNSNILDRQYSKRVVSSIWPWACIIALLALVYGPAMQGPYFFDDFPTFVENKQIQINTLDPDSLHQAITSSQTGPLGRPIPLLSMAVMYRFFGLDAFPQKVLNLIIHMLNVLLLGLVLKHLFLLLKAHLGLSIQVGPAAFWLAAIWALHPFNLTSVLYVVQRMASLACLFMLLSYYGYLKMRSVQITESNWGLVYAALALACFVCAMFSKENAVVILGIIFLTEVLLLKGKAGSTALTNTLNKLVGFGWLIILALIVVVIWHWGWFEASYERRGYTLEERVLTQMRVLWFYTKLIVIPQIDQMSFFHDDFPLSKGVLMPITTFIAIISWLWVLVGSWFVRKQQPLIFFGIAWFLIGHSVESTIISLEIIHEHRNYFPMIGILIASYGLLSWLWTKIKIDNTTKFHKISKCLLVGMLCLLTSGTGIRAQHWKDWPSLSQAEVLRNPMAWRAQHTAALWYLQVLTLQENPTADSEAYQKAYEHFTRTYQVNPVDVSGLFGLLMLHDFMQLPAEQQWIDLLLDRLTHTQIERETMKQIQQFIVCQIQQSCKPDLALVNQIVLSIEQNERAPVFFKAFLFQQIAILLDILGETELSLYHYAKADSFEPNNPLHDLGIALMLFKLSRFEQSQEALNTIDVRLLGEHDLHTFNELSSGLQQLLDGQ